MKKYNRDLPTINEICEGIKKQERVQLQLKSGLDLASDIFQKAYEGKCLAWDSYFSEITEIDHHTPLTIE